MLKLKYSNQDYWSYKNVLFSIKEEALFTHLFPILLIIDIEVTKCKQILQIYTKIP